MIKYIVILIVLFGILLIANIVEDKVVDINIEKEVNRKAEDDRRRREWERRQR